MIKTIILLIFVILLNSCVAMPVMNTAIPMKEGEERTTLSGGILTKLDNIQNKSIDEISMPYIYGNLAYKFDGIGVEFTINGVKLIEDLYLSKNLYIASYQSAYLILIGVAEMQVCFFLKTLVDTQKADEDEFMVLLGLSF